jgi:FkbM family methyltransferase
MTPKRASANTRLAAWAVLVMLYICLQVAISFLTLIKPYFLQRQDFIFEQQEPLEQSLSQDSMSLPSPVAYPTVTTSLDYNVLRKYPLLTVACAAGGKYPILMQNNGIHKWVCGQENHVTLAMLYVFNKYANENKAGLMLDVGANAGYYSLLAAKLGHKSVQFDLQPTCITILRNSVIVNGFSDRVWTIAAGVSDSHTNITVPNAGCDGRFPASAHEQKIFGTFKTSMPLHPLSHFLDPDECEIMLMKVDTEGNEKRVLVGAMDFFRQRKIQNAIVEVTKGYNFWKNAGITKDEVLAVFREICSYGYWMVSLRDSTIHRTAAEAVDYLEKTRFGQADMWLTLDENILKLTSPKLDGSFFKE